MELHICKPDHSGKPCPDAVLHALHELLSVLQVAGGGQSMSLYTDTPPPQLPSTYKTSMSGRRYFVICLTS